MPLSVALPLESTLLKLSWRNTNMIPFLILISIIDLKTQAKDFSLKSIWQNKNTRIGIMQLSLSFNLVQIFFILSGQYTIMSHASIFSNLGGAMLVIHRVILRQPTHRWEYSGVIIAMVGSIISVLDKDVKKIDESHQNIPFGDICGIISSLFAAYFFQKNSQVIQKVPSSIVVCLTIIISEILLVIFGLIFDTFTLDFNTHTGVFGFISKEYFLYTFFALGLFCGAMSIYTATLVLKYYPAVVLLITSLFEPLLCQAISCLMNIDKAPGLMTYLGGMLTLIGILGSGLWWLAP
ncbi:UNKNOWN [Stylonychia lemnae]|uniref:Drug metabolite transporter superfamily n=1 Tax=Stylonychia lemnae TaxID=5949 RepID=A0A078AW29_STYLE|nr:UNKNOWN [Stylonychia lemnae]|eukprot:CDW85422.1 UNKNOWN [Stylonychia lemnae]